MKTFAITGSASGIGASTRARLESNGHQVIGIDLHDAEIEADLRRETARAGAIAAVVELCGGSLDGLVTSAGVGPPFDPRAILAVNWLGTQAFLSGLRDALAAGPSIAKAVAVSSNSTTLTPGIPDELVEACLSMDGPTASRVLDEAGDAAMALAYGASKTAVARYVRRNAPSPAWAGAGIRLNAIAPGATLTPLLRSGLDDETYGPLIRSLPVPTGGFATPDQIAEWVVMMLSDAADFLCGSVIFVDGGSDALLRPDDWPVSSRRDAGDP